LKQLWRIPLGPSYSNPIVADDRSSPRKRKTRKRLRKLVAAEAAFAEVDALAEYYRSLADYRAALGMDTVQAQDDTK
jgi:hypothetical protein